MPASPELGAIPSRPPSKYKGEEFADPQSPHRIIAIGGGAGGLELTTRSGDRLAGVAKPKSP